MEFHIGQIVTGIYKTGKYIGEVTDIRPAHYVVKVLAVAKHPKQGDLHHPNEVNVPLFHERRALAYTERVNVPKTHVKEFNEEVPDYKESLKKAIEREIGDLSEKNEQEWAKKSIEILEGLRIRYKL